MTGELVVGVMPKELRNPYFESCAEGAREAARERGFTLRWEGPESPDAAAQAGYVTRWVRRVGAGGGGERGGPGGPVPGAARGAGAEGRRS